MKPTMRKRLINQAIANNSSNFKSLERQRTFGMFDQAEVSRMAIKDTNKLIKILKRGKNN